MKRTNWKTGSTSPSKRTGLVRTLSPLTAILVSVPSLLIILPL